MEEKNVIVTYFGDGKHQLKLSKSDFPLTIRSTHKDDVIELEHGSKKLSRVFIDNKVGRERRKDWPIVVNANGLILLVCGLTKHYNYTKKKVDYDYELYFYERNRR
jgi:tRNA(Ile)-lysidine synthase